MKKRTYTKVQILEREIVSMREAGIEPRSKSRPRKDVQPPYQNEAAELKRLRLKGQGIHRNPKTELRVMKKYDVLGKIRRPRKRRQMGQQVHRDENLLNREFHAVLPCGRRRPLRSCGSTAARVASIRLKSIWT